MYVGIDRAAVQWGPEPACRHDSLFIPRKLRSQWSFSWSEQTVVKYWHKLSVPFGGKIDSTLHEWHSQAAIAPICTARTFPRPDVYFTLHRLYKIRSFARQIVGTALSHTVVRHLMIMTWWGAWERDICVLNIGKIFHRYCFPPCWGHPPQVCF